MTESPLVQETTDELEAGASARTFPPAFLTAVWPQRFRNFDALTTVAGTLLLVGLIAFFSAERSSTFPTSANAKSILTTSSVLWILAIGLTVVLAINEFDLSFANVASLAGAVTVLTIAHHHWPVAPAVLAGLGVGLLVGVGNGVAVAYGRAPAFIVTLAFGSVAFGIEQFISSDNVVYGLPNSFLNITQKSIFGIPNPIVIPLVLTVLVYVLLEFSVWGRRIRAIGANRRAGELAGLPVGPSRVLAFAITGTIAGVAGIVLMSQADQYFPNSADGLLLPPYTAAFLGAAAVGRGLFGAFSTLYGIVFLGVLENGLTMMGEPGWLVTLIQGVALAAAVLLARQFR
jgi:ribose transport system permease protein